MMILPLPPLCGEALRRKQRSTNAPKLFGGDSNDVDVVAPVATLKFATAVSCLLHIFRLIRSWCNCRGWVVFHRA